MSCDREPTHPLREIAKGIRDAFKPPITSLTVEVDMKDTTWIDEQWKACKPCFKPDGIEIDPKMFYTCGLVLAGITAKMNATESSFTINSLRDKTTGKVFGDYKVMVTKLTREDELVEAGALSEEEEL